MDGWVDGGFSGGIGGCMEEFRVDFDPDFRSADFLFANAAFGARLPHLKLSGYTPSYAGFAARIQTHEGIPNELASETGRAG